MKSTVETLSPTRVRLDVEVPFDELKPSIDKAYKSLARQVNVPGFRKGKVPPRLIDRHVGRGAVLEQAINDAIPGALSKVFEEHELRVIGQPDVNPTELADGERFTFSADVEVRPDLELPEFDTLEVLVDEVEVSDADVEAEINQLADRFGTLTPVERPAATDDHVSIDLRATVDGEDIEGGTANNITYQVGKGDLLEGLDEALVGLSAGEDTTFTTKLVGGEHAGREAAVAITVNSVKVKELPEIDDEFAQTASEFDTVDQLRENTTEQLRQRRAMDQAVQARDKTLTALLGAVEVPLPEKVVEAEIEFRKHELGHYLERMGSSMESYLTNQGKSAEEFDEQLRNDAEEAVRAQLLLDTIADKEELGVNQQELTNEVVRRARQSYVAPQEYADHLMESGQIQLVAADIRRGKALSVALERAKVQDTAGNSVDINAIREQIAAATPQT